MKCDCDTNEGFCRGHTWEVTSGVYRRCSMCEIEKIAKEPDGLGDFKSYGIFTIGGVPWIWQFKDGKLTEKQVDRQMQFYSDISQGKKCVSTMKGEVK